MSLQLILHSSARIITSGPFDFGSDIMINQNLVLRVFNRKKYVHNSVRNV